MSDGMTQAFDSEREQQRWPLGFPPPGYCPHGYKWIGRDATYCPYCKALAVGQQR